jgi:transposase
MVQEHVSEYPSPWAAIRSIAEKIGCPSEALRRWVRQAERDQGQRPGLTTDERQQLKALQREVGELRRANDILRKASAYLPRRSSTADRSDRRLRGRAARDAWGRVDRPPVADRPVDILALQGAADRSDTPVGASAA